MSWFVTDSQAERRTRSTCRRSHVYSQPWTRWTRRLWSSRLDISPRWAEPVGPPLQTSSCTLLSCRSFSPPCLEVSTGKRAHVPESIDRLCFEFPLFISNVTYLEYVGDNRIVMFILLLVELLQVRGVITLTVSSHLLPHLSLLSCLKRKTKTQDMHLRDPHCWLNAQCPVQRRTLVKHTEQPEHKNDMSRTSKCMYKHWCMLIDCTYTNMEQVDVQSVGQPSYLNHICTRNKKGDRRLQDGQVWMRLPSRSSLCLRSLELIILSELRLRERMQNAAGVAYYGSTASRWR